jgi:hypothetical protein
MWKLKDALERGLDRLSLLLPDQNNFLPPSTQPSNHSTLYVAISVCFCIDKKHTDTEYLLNYKFPAVYLPCGAFRGLSLKLLVARQHRNQHNAFISDHSLGPNQG